MHVLNLTYLSVLAAAYFQFTQGSPLVGPLPELVVKCDPISKYDVDYFMGTKIYEPPRSTCLFYTAWLSAIAQRFANSGGSDMTTLWNIWPCHLYNGDIKDKTNRLRCFFDTQRYGEADRTTYFSHMSEAMAISCDTFATVMTNFTNNIPQNGIWGRVEQPALMRPGNPGRQVDTIVAVDLHGDNLVTVWERGNQPKDKRLDTGLVKRKPSDCYTPEQIQEWFGSVPW